MKHLLSMAALLGAALFLRGADAPAQEPPADGAVVVTERCEEIPCEVCPHKRGRPFLRWLLRSKFCEPACAKPFVADGIRYEPKLRDIRLVPRTHQLPGYDSGIPETLPVLPFYRDGYFQLLVR